MVVLVVGLLLAVSVPLVSKFLKSRVQNMKSVGLSENTPSPKPAINLPTSLAPLLQKVRVILEQQTQTKSTSISGNESVWWITDNGYNIINHSAYGVVANYECQNQPQHGFESATKTLEPIIPEVMRQEGFQKNLRNSSKSLSDLTFYDYVQAYEKDSLKCTFTANPDCTGYDESSIWQTITFSCTSNYDENYKNQIPFLKDLGIKDAIVQVEKQMGNYAKLQVHYRRTGSYLIAAKQNGVWKELYRGQDTPKCLVMNQYSVPKDIYGSCY